jgi:hypothetical protein
MSNNIYINVDLFVGLTQFQQTTSEASRES